MTVDQQPRHRVATHLFTASAIRYAGQLVTLLFIAHFLGATNVGRYTVALAICAPIYTVAAFGTRLVYLTLQRSIHPKIYERFLSTSLLAALTLTAAISLFLPPDLRVVLLIVAGIRVCETFINLYNAMLQRANRTGVLSLVIACGTGAQILAVGVVFVAGGSLEQALMASGVSLGVNTVLLTRRVAHSPYRLTPVSPLPHPDRGIGEPRPWRVLFAAGVVSGSSEALISLLSAVPQYLLALDSRLEEAGTFAILLYFVVAVEMVLHATAQSWIPAAKALLAAGDLTLGTVVRTGARWAAVIGSAGLVALAAGWVLLPHLLGAEFRVTAAVAVPLALCIVTVPMVFAADTAIATYNRYSLSFVISSATLFLSIALGGALSLLGSFDLPRALWTFAATMAARAVGGLITISRLSGGARSGEERGRGAATILAAGWHRYWPLLPITAVITAVVLAGTAWSLGLAVVVIAACLGAALRLTTTDLVIMAVPFSFYVPVGFSQIDVSLADVVLVFIIIRVVADPACRGAIAEARVPVLLATTAWALFLALTSTTVLARSALGAALDWPSFLAAAVKLTTVIAYFVCCLIVFRQGLARGSLRPVVVWARTAVVVGATGAVGAVLYSVGIDTGLTLDFRANSTFQDPNAFASYLVLSLPLVMFARHRAGKSLLGWQLLPLLAGIYASYSRGALVGLGALFVVLIIFSLRYPALRAVSALFTAATAIVLGLVAFTPVTNPIFDSRGAGFDADVRYQLWDTAVQTWLQSPVVGVGFGQFRTASGELLDLPATNLVHNTYLSILTEGGVLGLALYLVVPAVVVGMLRAHRGVDSALLLSAGVGLGAMALSLNLENFRPLWMFLALAVALSMPGTQEPQRTDPSGGRTRPVKHIPLAAGRPKD